MWLQQTRMSKAALLKEEKRKTLISFKSFEIQICINHTPIKREKVLQWAKKKRKTLIKL